MRRLPLMLAAVLLIVVAIARASPAPAAVARFDLDAAAPYFSSGPAASARDQLTQQAWTAAADGFLAYLKRASTGDRVQASFLAAYALAKAGNHRDAAQRFDVLAKTYPLLAPYHAFYAGRAWLALGDPAAALARGRQVPADSPLDAEARLLRGEALQKLGRNDEAEREYRQYLSLYPDSWRTPEVRFRVAELLAAGGAPRWVEAKAGYLDVYIHWPTESWARLAEQRLRSRAPDALMLSPADHLARGLAYFNEQRNPEAEAELAAALGGDLSPAARCAAAYHMAQSVFKARQRPRAAPLFDAAVSACENAVANKTPSSDGDPAANRDLLVKALYQGARCHAANSDAASALARFARIETAYAAHSYADDARLRQAEVYDSQAERARDAAKQGKAFAGGKPDDLQARADALLGDLAERYPDGDMKSEALFRLFFRHWRAGRLAEARRWLQTLQAKVPREEGWWDAGRTLYWLGRVAEREGQRELARTHYVRCVKEYPLAYYALAALNRLRDTDATYTRRLLDELASPKPTAAEQRWQFTARPLFDEPAFRRGIELMRLGLGAEARRELSAVGIRAPGRDAARQMKEQTLSADATELLWLVAVLYDRAGEYSASHSVPRYALTDYERHWPVGPHKKEWLIAYPRGYFELIRDNTQKTGQPLALELAIVREESAFDPTLESFANAIGLTQLTFPAAQRFAQGLPVSRETLRDPAINVAIGARELGFLWQKYMHHPALAIAGYNAGEGAVRRWVRAAPRGTALDEFIEAIPFDETRGYTKRVLASYFAYSWLYDHAVPALPFIVPGVAAAAP